MRKSVRIAGRSIPMITLIILGLSAGLVIGAVLITRNVGMNLNVIALFDIKLYDTDGTTELTTITLTDFHRNEAQTFPSETTHYLITNTGDMIILPSWTVSGLPSGVTVIMKRCLEGSTNWQFVDENILDPPLAPGVSSKWRLVISVDGTATIGSYPLILSWIGNNGP